MRKLTPLVPIVLVALFVLAACGAASTASTPPPATQPPAANAPAAPAVPLATATTAPAANAPAANQAAPTMPPAAPTTAPAATAKPAALPTAAISDTLSLVSRDQGLDKLQSYHTQWQAQWTSTSITQTDKGTWLMTQDYSANPPARHTSYNITDPTGKNANGKTEIYQIGDTSYIIATDDQGKTQCTSFSSSDKNNPLAMAMVGPTNMGGLSGAKYAGTDTINGISTKHYTYDQTSAATLGFTKAAGDTWVAVDGGYVVKDTLNWQGSKGPFGGSTQSTGTGSWTYEVSNVNQPLTIKAPDGCASPSTGLPVMPDATNKMSAAGMTSYSSASKVADIITFYQTELAKLGWQPNGSAQTFGPVTTLQFSKSGQSLTISITVNGQAAQVVALMQ